MLVAFSMTLSRVAKHYSPPGTNVHHTNTVSNKWKLRGGDQPGNRRVAAVSTY